MLILEKLSEVMAQITGFATVSIGDVLSSAFLRLVLFLVDLMLGL